MKIEKYNADEIGTTSCNRHPAEAEIEGINPKSILSMDDTDDNVKEKIEEEIKSLLNNLK